MTWDEITERVGSLGKPSKMPGHSYGLPISACVVGARLRLIGGTPCAACYAGEGNYDADHVRAAQGKRLASLQRSDWVEVMAEAITKTGDRHFRWHDSGDLQGLGHLLKIVHVARRTPKVRHYLPTREVVTVRFWLSRLPFPPNLVVRISGNVVGRAGVAVPGALRAAVHVHKVPEGAFACPAKRYGNTCGPCRACWSHNADLISYPAKWGAGQLGLF